MRIESTKLSSHIDSGLQDDAKKKELLNAETEVAYQNAVQESNRAESLTKENNSTQEFKENTSEDKKGRTEVNYEKLRELTSSNEVSKMENYQKGMIVDLMV